MILDNEDQEVDIAEEDLDTSVSMPETIVEEESPSPNELDIDLEMDELSADEEYDKKVEEGGDWGMQDVTNIAAGAGSGVARAFTGTLSLAADLADMGMEAAGFEGFEDKTLESIHSTLDLSDNIAELAGADENAQAFKTSRAISEGITIGIQMLVGVGAVSAGAKASKALLKTGGIKGVARLAKKGGQAVAKGSKKQAAAKTAGVVAGEEFLSEENANEGGFIIDTFLRDSEDADKKVDEIHDPLMGIISRSDPDFAMVADEYLAVNGKSEKKAYDRLVGRLEGVVDGLAFGAVVGTAAKALSAADLGKYFRSVKQTKVNANVARDFKLDQAYISKKVDALSIKGEEVTDEMMKGFKEEAKTARKEAQKQSFEEVEKIYEEKIFGKTGILNEVRTKVDEAADFFEDENIAGIFNRASSGGLLDNVKTTFKNKAGEIITKESSDIQTFRNLAKGNDRLATLTGKKKDFWLKATDREIADVMQDKKFLGDVQKKFATDRLIVTEQRLKLTDEMGAVKTRIADFLEETGEVPSNLLMSQQALIAADTAMELKGSAMNSLSGQFLRLAKDDKNFSVSSINRFVENQRKRFNSDIEFSRFEAKMFSDKKFLEENMGTAANASKLMKTADLMHDFYRQHLLTSVKGVIRNVGEGVVLSGIRMGRDVLADPKALKAVKDTFSRDNTTLAFSRFKKAMQGKSDFDDSSKLGASAITEYASISEGLKATVLKATQMGRRSVIAGDKLISTYNEAYFMNKNILGNIEGLSKSAKNIEGLAGKIKANANLTVEEVRQFNDFKGMGIDPVNFMKNVDEQGVDGAMDFAIKSMQENPALIMQAKKYADKIAMNMDIEDMGGLAKGMSKPVLALSEWPPTRMFMPFPRPALSALDETIEWTPLMNLPRLAKRFSEGSAIDKKEAIVQAGMSLTGGAAVWELFTQGILTGSGPKDQRANKAWKSFNTPNSINVGGQAISIQGTILGSIGSIIGEAHDLMETHDDGSLENDEKKKLISAGIVSILADLPANFWTDSLDPLLRALKPQGDRALESSQAAIVNNLVKSIPGVGLVVQGASQIKSGTEGSRSDTATKTGKEPMQRSWNEFKKNMLFMDVPKRVSFITGEELETGATWKKPVLSMASFQGSKHKEVGNYLNALLQDSGSKNSRSSRDYLRFTEPERTIKSSAFTGITGISYKLNADEYEEITRLTAQPTGFPPMTEAIKQIMNEMPLESLAGSSQQEKDMAISLIKDTMKEYKSAAREEFMLSSEEYQSWARDTRVKEQDRSEEEANFNL